MKKEYIGIALTLLSAPLTASDFEKSPEKAIRPQDVLADGKEGLTLSDGTFVRKGTIKATFDNIDLLNEIMHHSPGKEREKRVDAILRGVTDIMPALISLRLFKIFTACEWLQNNQSPGRILVVLTYLEACYQKDDDQEHQRLLKCLKKIQTTFKDHEILSRTEKIMQKWIN